MSEQQLLDLYSLILRLGETEWIDESRIFGSRRYLSNASYGSDVDLLVVPSRQIQIDKLRALIHEQYIDAFLVDRTLAISAANARIPPYYRAHVKTSSGKDRQVIAVQTGVAGVNAGISATRILDYFDQPELAVLVGITAGLKDEKTLQDSRKAPVLGDILVPTATVDVESGKLTPKGKEKAGLTIPVSPYYQRAVASWAGFNA